MPYLSERPSLTARRFPRNHEVLPALAWVIGFALLILGLTALLTEPAVPASVVAPLGALMAAPAALLFVLWRRRRGVVPWFEIGVVYTAVVGLYAVYPLAKFLVVGEGYQAVERDSRWTILAPSLSEVVSVIWVYVAHTVAFVLVYLVSRGRLSLARPPMQPPPRPVLLAIIALYALVQGFWWYLGLFYDTSAGTYIESYLVSRRLPLLLAQLLNHLNGAKYPLALVIMAGLFARYSKTRLYILAWIAIVAVLAFVSLGSRTELALMLMAAGMMYHTIVRPLSPRAVGAGVAAGIGAFIALGMVRAGAQGSELGSLNPFLYSSEFDILFGNALELARANANGELGPIPRTLYFSDLTALLPQQIAPFEKIDPASWFVTRFHPAYAEIGGGMAFGTMAEAVISGGWSSAAARGAALGFCFAKIHRFYEARAQSYWRLVFYVWATTLAYQSFRNTTFALLVLFVYRFLPVVIGTKLITAALDRAAARTKLQRSTPARFRTDLISPAE